MWDFFKNLFGGKKTPQGPPGYFISPSGQSQQRIDKLDLTTASEDASHILARSRISFPPPHKYEYKGNPDLEWLIDITPPAGGTFDRDKLWKAFDKDWRQAYDGFELYGLSTADNSWHYVISGDSPQSYDQIQVGCQLVERYIDPEEFGIMSGKSLENFRKALLEKIHRNFPGATLQEQENIPLASGKANKLADLQQRFGKSVNLVLKSDTQYSGLQAWDALLSVGLRWGDMDLFHWFPDEVSNVQQLFSVWTATHPGYFFPEDIKKGFFNPKELIFGFSIPRSFDAVGIFDAMMDAAEYCRGRLGGEFVDVEGHAFGRYSERASLVNLVKEMKDAGLEPGSTMALQLF